MKKTVCLIFAVALCVALAVPSMASLKSYSDGATIPAGTKNGIGCRENANVKIDGLVDPTDNSIVLQTNSALTVTETGQLVGKNVYYYPYDPTTKIILKNGGKIELEFASTKCVNSFTSLLDGSGIGYTVSDKTVKAISGSGTGSILSDGNLWIIVTVAVVAIAGIAILIIVNKRKKVATAGAETTVEKIDEK